MFNFKVVPTVRPKNQGLVEEKLQKKPTCALAMILRLPGWAGADLPLENQSRKKRQSRKKKKKKYKNIKEKNKITRMGAGGKAAKAGTAGASCATSENWLLYCKHCKRHGEYNQRGGN